MLSEIKNKLIVSCQALEDEPLHGSLLMAKMALAAKIGGASAIRSNSVEDIIAIKKEIDLPVIGLFKKDYIDSDVYITPTKKEVLALIKSGCDMIAIDGTNRKRPNGESIKELVELIHENLCFAMADISNLEEAISAEKLGCDCISTALSGYTSYSLQSNEPDYQLIKSCVELLKIPVIAEGKVSENEHLKKVLECSPYAVVIGSAISRPQNITKKFLKVFNNCIRDKK